MMGFWGADELELARIILEVLAAAPLSPVSPSQEGKLGAWEPIYPQKLTQLPGILSAQVLEIPGLNSMQG